MREADPEEEEEAAGRPPPSQAAMAAQRAAFASSPVLRSRPNASLLASQVCARCLLPAPSAGSFPAPRRDLAANSERRTGAAFTLLPQAAPSRRPAMLVVAAWGPRSTARPAAALCGCRHSASALTAVQHVRSARRAPALLPARRSRQLTVRSRAMVNVDFASPSLVLGAILIGCGVLLLQVRLLLSL